MEPYSKEQIEEMLLHPEDYEIPMNPTKEDIEMSDYLMEEWGLKGSTSTADTKKYVVRLFDMFDGWIDISKAISKEEADALWNERTKNGTQKTKFADGDYYAIFPANTTMVFTPEFLGR